MAWKIHAVTCVEHLELASPIMAPTDSAPTPTYNKLFLKDLDRFDIDCVLDKKVRLLSRTHRPVTFYLIQWKGFRSRHDEWVHERNAIGAEQKIAEFEARSQ